MAFLEHRRLAAVTTTCERRLNYRAGGKSTRPGVAVRML